MDIVAFWEKGSGGECLNPTFQQDWTKVVSSLCNEAKTWATFGFTGNVGSIAAHLAIAVGGKPLVGDIDKALVRCQDTNRFHI